MNKSVKISILVTLTFCSFLTGCENKQNPAKVVSGLSSADAAAYNIDYTEIDQQCSISTDEYTKFAENMNITEAKPNNLFYEPIQILTPGVFNLYGFYEEQWIVGIYPENDESQVELGLYDYNTNTYTSLGTVAFNFGYNDPYFVLDETYFVFQKSVYDSDSESGLSGEITICNLQTGDLDLVDRYDVHNIVQAITAVGDHAMAYFYYEAGTQDWVVRYYDMETGISKEIFRHTNRNENETVSPMTITSHDTEIALVIQYAENNTGHTALQWMSTEGELLSTEEIPLDELFGQTAYEITFAYISGNYYCFSADNTTQQGTIILRREGDTFYPVSTGEYILDYVPFPSNENTLSFVLQCSESVCGALQADFKSETIYTSLFPAEATIKDGKIQNCYITPQQDCFAIIYDYDSGDDIQDNLFCTITD